MEQLQEAIDKSAGWFMGIPWTDGEVVMLAGISVAMLLVLCLHLHTRATKKKATKAKVVSLGEQMKAMTRAERAAYIRSRLAEAVFNAVEAVAEQDDLAPEDVNKFLRSFARSHGMWDLASRRFCKHPHPEDLKQAIQARLGDRLHELRAKALARQIAKSPIVVKAPEPPPIPVQVETKKANPILSGLRLNGRTQHA